MRCPTGIVVVSETHKGAASEGSTCAASIPSPSALLTKKRQEAGVDTGELDTSADKELPLDAYKVQAQPRTIFRTAASNGVFNETR